MKSIKMMLLGIAVLIIATWGFMTWTIGGIGDGAILFFAGLVVGSILIIRGFFKREQ